MPEISTPRPGGVACAGAAASAAESATRAGENDHLVNRRSGIDHLFLSERTNGLFSVLFGVWLFGEGRVRQSLVGAGIMFGGVVLIAVGGS